ncbi:MAG TPA: DUF488 family protein [Pirellulales bacterium]|nr:DUF488 family protein [Pirellulales bacterium]
MFQLKRAYEPASRDDGCRVLVERLWPRGVTKSKAAIDAWLKDVAPSAELRKWYGHVPERWTEFRRRYWSELRSHPEAVRELRAKEREGKVTLVYAAHDVEHSGALALKQFLGRHKTKAGAGAR